MEWRSLLSKEDSWWRYFTIDEASKFYIFWIPVHKDILMINKDEHYELFITSVIKEFNIADEIEI